jgi:fibro-slime domain-containing protein
LIWKGEELKMKRRAVKRFGRFGLAIAMVFLFSGFAIADTIDLTGTIRDFKRGDLAGGHPDFETFLGDDRGIVKSDLGGDQKPVYDSLTTTLTTTGAANFDQWYRNVSGVNQSLLYQITLTETSPGSGIYSYENSTFFPIDNQLWGNEGLSHNYHFTYEIHTKFTYQLGQDFEFTGDDDVWVFINKNLVIDLGGVHGAENASVDLNTLGLTVGDTYDFDLFFAERHTTHSNLKIRLAPPGNGIDWCAGAQTEIAT